MAGNEEMLSAANQLFAAIEQGNREELLALYAHNAVQVEHPNRLKPKGDRRAPEKMAADLARGKAMLRSEHYQVVEATAMGDRLALQVKWTGVVAVAVGVLQPGDEMVCESGIFLRFVDGKIAEQHNYDCFEDFLTPRG